MLMALHPKVQSKCQDEIVEIIGDKPPTIEDTSDLKNIIWKSKGALDRDSDNYKQIIATSQILILILYCTQKTALFSFFF